MAQQHAVIDELLTGHENELILRKDQVGILLWHRHQRDRLPWNRTGMCCNPQHVQSGKAVGAFCDPIDADEIGPVAEPDAIDHGGQWRGLVRDPHPYEQIAGRTQRGIHNPVAAWHLVPLIRAPMQSRLRVNMRFRSTSARFLASETPFISARALSTQSGNAVIRAMARVGNNTRHCHQVRGRSRSSAAMMSAGAGPEDYFVIMGTSKDSFKYPICIAHRSNSRRMGFYPFRAPAVAEPACARQSLSSSLIGVFERVCASTFWPITAQ